MSQRRSDLLRLAGQVASAVERQCTLDEIDQFYTFHQRMLAHEITVRQLTIGVLPPFVKPPPLAIAAERMAPRRRKHHR